MPVLVGGSLVYHVTGVWDWPLFLVVLLGMLALHGGANTANDYFDHLSGADEANTEFVRPFTGGSRLIQNGVLSPGEVLGLSAGCFALAGAVGVFLVINCGVPILLLGLTGALCGFFYTGPPFKLVSRGVGEIVVGLNFGVLPVLGTYYVLAGEFSREALLVSFPVAILVMAILFINQFQDAPGDASTGKRHWVVRLGTRRASRVYAVMALGWPVVLVAAVAAGAAPPAVLAGLLGVPVAVFATLRALRFHGQSQELAPANAATIVLHLGVCVVMSAALIISR